MSEYRLLVTQELSEGDRIVEILEDTGFTPTYFNKDDYRGLTEFDGILIVSGNSAINNDIAWLTGYAEAVGLPVIGCYPFKCEQGSNLKTYPKKIGLSEIDMACTYEQLEEYLEDIKTKVRES